MSHWTEKPGTIASEDREAFLRENAVAVVEELEAKVLRMRKTISTLVRNATWRRRVIRKLKALLREHGIPDESGREHMRKQ